MNQTQEAIVMATEVGYEATQEGKVMSPSGCERKLSMRNQPDKYGHYLRFTFAFKDDKGKKRWVSIPVHQLVAYQKYHELSFHPEIEVRHKNGNSQDNSWGNILIGNKSQNAMDKTKETRVEAARQANRKFDDEALAAIVADHQNGMSYKKLMQKYGISSKGTVSYIIRKSMSAKMVAS